MLHKFTLIIYFVLASAMCIYGTDVYMPFSNESPSNRYIQHAYKQTYTTKYNKFTHTAPTGQGYKVFSNFFSENKHNGYYNNSVVTTNSNYSYKYKNETNNYQQTYTYNFPTISFKSKITGKETNDNSYYEINEEKPTTTIRQKAVITNPSFRDWLKNIGAIISGDAGYSSDGKLITEDDWEAYKTDPDYKDYIDNGGSSPYDDYQEQFGAPLDDCPFVFIIILLISYILLKLFKQKTIKD